jgi:hypothetical protein
MPNCGHHKPTQSTCYNNLKTPGTITIEPTAQNSLI